MIIAVQNKPKNHPSYYMDYEATLLSGNWPSDEDLVTKKLGLKPRPSRTASLL